MTVFVLRTPQFMEDEGRYFFAGSFQTVAEARVWIARQADADAYIVTVLA